MKSPLRSSDRIRGQVLAHRGLHGGGHFLRLRLFCPGNDSHVRQGMANAVPHHFHDDGDLDFPGAVSTFYILSWDELPVFQGFIFLVLFFFLGGGRGVIFTF